jgi:type II secretory pathway component GspD/PulD (secretin)
MSSLDSFKRIVCCFVPGFLTLALAGCTESVVRQYTALGKWQQGDDHGTVISGSPDADASAYAASGDMLSEADWQILEKIAPRPIWEQLAEARETLGGEVPTAPNTDEPARAIAAPALTAEQLAQEVRATDLGDGRIRVLYRMRHYGGPSVSSSRDGGTERRHIKLGTSDLASVVAAVSQELGDKGTCLPLPSENALLITCPAEMKMNILSLLADLDAPAQQVEITARIFEVNNDFDFQIGAQLLLNHIASDNTQNLASTFNTKAFLDHLKAGGGTPFQGSALKLMQVFGNSGIAAEATFQALADGGMIREVASPRMTVAAGHTGYVLAGQELPINSARISNDQLVTEKTTYKPVGVQLHITPRVISGQSVKLHVVTVVSSISGFRPQVSLSGADSLQTLINPILDSREAETSVSVEDGSTLVIGGLRMVRNITRERKVPGLGDIPVIQWLFKNHRSQRRMSDLYFFVTPKIIR